MTSLFECKSPKIRSNCPTSNLQTQRLYAKARIYFVILEKTPQVQNKIMHIEHLQNIQKQSRMLNEAGEKSIHHLRGISLHLQDHFACKTFPKK